MAVLHPGASCLGNESCWGLDFSALSSPVHAVHTCDWGSGPSFPLILVTEKGFNLLGQGKITRGQSSCCKLYICPLCGLSPHRYRKSYYLSWSEVSLIFLQIESVPNQPPDMPYSWRNLTEEHVETGHLTNESRSTGHICLEDFFLFLITFHTLRKKQNKCKF